MNTCPKCNGPIVQGFNVTTFYCKNECDVKKQPKSIQFLENQPLSYDQFTIWIEANGYRDSAKTLTITHAKFGHVVNRGYDWHFISPKNKYEYPILRVCWNIRNGKTKLIRFLSYHRGSGLKRGSVVNTRISEGITIKLFKDYYERCVKD